jgi:hypothetical protein
MGSYRFIEGEPAGMNVIDFERWRIRRRNRRANGQIAALFFIREEVQEAGFQVAANLINLAAASIADELRKRSQPSNDVASNDMAGNDAK